MNQIFPTGRHLGHGPASQLILAVILLLPVIFAPAASAQLRASAAADATVTLTWTASGDDGDVGTAAQYDLRYSTSPLTASNWNDATPVTTVPTPLPSGTIQQCSVESLGASTTYYFAIRAADEAANWSGLSNVVSVTTPGDTTPPGTVADLDADTGL